MVEISKYFKMFPLRLFAINNSFQYHQSWYILNGIRNYRKYIVFFWRAGSRREAIVICYVLHVGLPFKMVWKLQLGQNIEACLLISADWYSHTCFETSALVAVQYHLEILVLSFRSWLSQGSSALRFPSPPKDYTFTFLCLSKPKSAKVM